MKAIATVGWDIGGAHIKMVVCNPCGEVTQVLQRPCPLWQGLARLQTAVRQMVKQLTASQYRHAITMTGELVDAFASRDEGVKAILNTMTELLIGCELWVFAGKQGLLPLEKVTSRHYPLIASSNWLASASFAAQKFGDGLFVDIGSTTTDILLLAGGEVKAQGFTDYQRLLSQELVYTGIIRTPVMAIAQTVLDEGGEVGVMAEYFATMADVYRLTGELDEAHDQTCPADGGEKTGLASAKRLARMVGCDFVAAELPRWRRLAGNLRSQQLEKIRRSCNLILTSSECDGVPVIGAGVGRFLAKQMAGQLGCPYLDFNASVTGQFPASTMDVADCAPAAALAVWLAVGGKTGVCNANGLNPDGHAADQ